MRGFISKKKELLKEESVLFVFYVSLILKGFLSLSEIAAGIFASFASKSFILSIAGVLTRGELAEEPADFAANYFLHVAQSFSSSTEHFVAFYLLSHGVIKLWLIIGLLRKKMWYYPAAIAFFSFFIIYQIYRFTFTHSIWLLAITFFDFAVIWLIWYEYRILKSKKQ